MSTYTATARREGDFWVVEIYGVGATQGVDKADAAHMARDYIAIRREIPIEDVRVDITFHEPSDAPWDAMVDAAMEIIRRDAGYPSVADMDRGIPAWRRQCEEIVTAMLNVLLGSVESPLEDDGRRCPRCNPDNTCTLWCLDSAIAENTPQMIQEVFALRRRCAELAATMEATSYTRVLTQYTELLAEFNKINGERCGAFTCDHLASIHGDMGCEFCSCPNFARKSTP